MLAGARLGCGPEDLETAGGRIWAKGTEKEMRIADLYRGWGKTCVDKVGEILGIGHFRSEIVLEDENGQSPRMVSYYCQGSHGVEVAVNTDTGEVKILRAVGCFDAGQPVNPKICEQQIEGGISMGIGSSITEEIVLENGRVLNPNYGDYKILSAADHPTIENYGSIVTDGYPLADGPFGARGLGEGVVNPFAPAVSNAVYNAVGVRIDRLPITREKVLSALKKKAGQDAAPLGFAAPEAEKVGVVPPNRKP